MISTEPALPLDLSIFVFIPASIFLQRNGAELGSKRNSPGTVLTRGTAVAPTDLLGPMATQVK